MLDISEVMMDDCIRCLHFERSLRFDGNWMLTLTIVP